MKYIYVYGLFLMSVFFTSCGQNQTNVSKNYIIIDTKQSAVVWRGSMLLASWEGTTLVGDGCYPTGDVDILKGELLIENRRLVGGAVEVDMNTIENFADQRSLNKLPAFFDVKKFPVSTFAITEVETVNDGKTEGRNGNMTIEGVAAIKVTGNLTIEGITRAVTFPANMLFKDGMDGTVVMNGTLIIDRTDWGIDYASEKHFDKSGDGTISDEVKLLMRFIAKLPLSSFNLTNTSHPYPIRPSLGADAVTSLSDPPGIRAGY